MHGFLLRDDEAIFEQINMACSDTNESIADFVRDAIRIKLRYHEQVTKPLYREFSARKDKLPDPILFLLNRQ